MKSPLLPLLNDKLRQLRAQLLASQIEVSRMQASQAPDSHEQPAESQNPETLHTLRVSLRQLHSLLLPLGKHLSGAADLDREVKRSLKLTNQIRDQEVLIQELMHQHHPELAQVYTTRLQGEIERVYRELRLDKICKHLDMLPDYWARKVPAREAKQLSRYISAEWLRTRDKLTRSIRQATPDKHRLRLLIKQLRYNSESYAAILPKKMRTETARLKQVQEVLGTWHDVEVWLEAIKVHPDLAILAPNWQQNFAYWDQAADQALLGLKRAWLR